MNVLHCRRWYWRANDGRQPALAGDLAKGLLAHDPCGDLDRFIHRHLHYFSLIAGTRSFDKYIA